MLKIKPKLIFLKPIKLEKLVEKKEREKKDKD